MKYFIIPLSFALLTTTLAAPAPKVQPVTTPIWVCATEENSPTTADIANLVTHYKNNKGVCSFGTEDYCYPFYQFGAAAIGFCGAAALYDCNALGVALQGIYGHCKQTVNGVERAGGKAIFEWGSFYLYAPSGLFPHKKKVPEKLVLDSA